MNNKSIYHSVWLRFDFETWIIFLNLFWLWTGMGGIFSFESFSILVLRHEKRPKMYANQNWWGQNVHNLPILCGLQYKQMGLIFIGILCTKCLLTLSWKLLHYILVNLWIFLSKSLWLVVLIQNVNIFGQICPWTRFAGSHLFSCSTKIA